MTLLIYDCDGVLVDSEAIANQVMADLMTTLGHPLTAAESVRHFVGRRMDDVLVQMERLLGRPVPARTIDRFSELLTARLRAELKPVPGAPQAVAALAYPRCVASSSSPERIGLSLDVTGLAPLFGSHVYSAMQVARGKPAPDLFLFAARIMGGDPAQALVIEDSPLGIQAAKAAGMRAIGFAGGAHTAADLPARLVAAGADLVIATMDALPGAVAKLVDPQAHRSSVGAA